jgi:hypothetical protein
MIQGMRKLLPGVQAFIAAAFIVLVAAGGGHGSYLPAKILFPLPLLSAAYIPRIGQGLSIFSSSYSCPSTACSFRNPESMPLRFPLLI